MRHTLIRLCDVTKATVIGHSPSVPSGVFCTLPPIQHPLGMCSPSRQRISPHDTSNSTRFSTHKEPSQASYADLTCHVSYRFLRKCLRSPLVFLSLSRANKVQQNLALTIKLRHPAVASRHRTLRIPARSFGDSGPKRDAHDRARLRVLSIFFFFFFSFLFASFTVLASILWLG